MANYTIHHSCGHNTDKQLYGPHDDRDAKIAWMEERPCYTCWQAEERKKNALKPITITVKTNGLDHDANGNILAEIILTGGTEPHKEAIKQLGYRWDTPRGGIMSMLSTSTPSRAWIKQIPILSLTEQAPSILASIRAIDPRAEWKVEISQLDLEMARKSLADREAKVAAHPKPQRPEWYVAMLGTGRWNGKIYGNDRYGYRIYVNDIEHRLTSEQASELRAYNEQRLAHNAALVG